MLQLANQVDNVIFENQHPDVVDSRAELTEGLLRRQKSINPKYFYDARGSALFEQITATPEYYPTRTEIAILTRCAEEIAEYCGSGCVLIEPGSGSSEKVRLLLQALRPSVYVPIDISANFLHDTALQLGEAFPWLRVHAVCADFSRQWQLPEDLPEGKRVAFYPGSTIGNLEPPAAQDFLRQLRDWIGADGGVLIGVDLHKSAPVLNAAYNDAQGVTAEFNLNVLSRVNQLLEADFVAERFRHHAFYNSSQRRIEMHLVSSLEQRVRVNGQAIAFAAGETIHTENSYKYTLGDFEQLVEAAGLRIQHIWLDDDELFSVHYLAAD